MKTVKKRSFFFRLIILCGIGLVLLALKYGVPKRVRAEFSLGAIRPIEGWTAPPPRPLAKADQDKRDGALAQPFFYLGTGTTCHAFVSEDRRYVIKFFRSRCSQLSTWLAHLARLNMWGRQKGQIAKMNQEGALRTRRSVLEAQRVLKWETGLIAVHFCSAQPLQKNITLFDGLGVSYEIALGEVDFIVQRYAERIDRYLLALRQVGAQQQAKQVITALFTLILQRVRKGYFDSDPNFVLNFGVMDGRVVQLDVGGFYRSAHKNIETFYSQELQSVQKRFLPWAKRHYPEVIAHFKSEIARLRLQRPVELMEN